MVVVHGKEEDRTDTPSRIVTPAEVVGEEKP